MSQQIVVKCNGVILKDPDRKVRELNEVMEKTRKDIVKRIVNIVLPTTLALKLAMADPDHSLANATQNAEEIRKGFQELLDVFTALAEPILWFYALTACILMVTKDKNVGWNRLKHVVYAYVGIALLPTFFSLLRWVSEMVRGAIAL